MRLLLDTHIAVWSMAEPERLSKSSNALIASPANEIWLSVVSIWELAIKGNSGRMDVSPEELIENAEEMGFDFLDITAAHAVAVGKLPSVHRDPFDRMLIAQAKVEQLRIVTADYTFDKYGCDAIFI